MSDPAWAPARRLAGNYDDDDGQVISDLVTTDPTPPDPFPAASTEVPPPSPAPKRPTRLLAGFLTFDVNSGLAAQLIAPEDCERELLKLSVRRTGGSAGNAFLLLAEEKTRMTASRADGFIPNFGEGARVYESGTFDAGPHTGALWVALGQPLTGADQLVLSWAVVTGGDDS